jgi:hypothetical protein
VRAHALMGLHCHSRLLFYNKVEVIEVTNIPAYYSTELITPIKIFIVHALGNDVS